MDFDFVTSPNDPPPTIGHETPEPQLTLKKLTPSRFAQDIGEVYQKLGATTWLLQQAEVAPQEFMKLLSRLLPKQMDLGSLEGLSIRLIDQFGQTLEVSANSKTALPGQESRQPLVATLPKSLLHSSPPARVSGTGSQTATSGTPAVNVIDVYPEVTSG